MKNLYVIIGVDCDHDRKRCNTQINNKKICWSGYLNIYKNFNPIREEVLRHTELLPALTLNIRSDSQVKMTNIGIYNSYDYCFKLFDEQLAKFSYNIDQTAWHHHLYRFVNNRWVPELNDDNWIERNIYETFEEIKQYAITTLHTGWCFQNTASMNAYNDVGIKVDYSALPGVMIPNRCDYSKIEPNMPYIPSRFFYQKKGPNTGNVNSILEIPTTTTNNKLMRHLMSLKTRTIMPQATFLQITISPYLFRPFLRSIFKAYSDIEYFISYFHADELLPDELKTKSALFLYGKNNLLSNILYLIKIAGNNGYRVRFTNFDNFLKTRRWKS